MTGEQIAGVFDRLSELRPELTEWFSLKRVELTEELSEMHGGPIARPLTPKEMAQVQACCQNYCDRMSGILRALALVASTDFPELADRFRRVSAEAANILSDYKEWLSLRVGTVEVTPDPEPEPVQVVNRFNKKRALLVAVGAGDEDDERAAVEKAMSTE